VKKEKSRQKYAGSGQEVSPWKRRWKPRFSLLFAFVVPGLPQILHRNQPLLGSILFFFGTGALITMVISLFISGGDIRAFDFLYAIITTDLSNVYPMHISPSAVSSDKLVPIHPPGEPLLVQPFFRELLYFHIILYIVCASISFWYQWKSGNKVSK
jgi:hypothetical protein